MCAWLVPFESLPIHLRVHPEEMRRARSTSWLAHRLLSNSTYTLDHMDPEPDYSRCALLFPGNHSLPWNQCTFDGVVVVDGTWDECSALIRRSPQLNALPRIGLQKRYTGAYEIRRPPWEGALCTTEAIGRLLQEMGNENGLRLLDLVSRLNERETILSGKIF